MNLPPGALSNAHLRALMVVMKQRMPSNVSVAKAIGRDLDETYEILVRLREEGLVSWEEGCSRSLRATVPSVALPLLQEACCA
jgi:predicted transcriptional regulator